MKSTFALWLLGALLLGSAPATAQYMRITTDNPADSGKLRATGTTILTITLDTIHDRDGTVQTCNSHTSRNCGASTSSQPLNLFEYTIALKAAGGTVAWGTFTPNDAAYGELIPQMSNSTEVEINRSRFANFDSPGLHTLGTLPVTPLTGNPEIQVQIGAGTLNAYGFGTGFGTSCDGYFFPNTYVVGDPADPCGRTNGIAGDWFDWDGAHAAFSANSCPSANPGGPYAGLAGVPVEFDGSASSDPDGDPLTYAWDFDATNGIGTDAVGAVADHIFTSAGTFTVTLTVRDNGHGDPTQACSRSGTTTTTIAAACAARVFNGYDLIRLSAGKPIWYAYVQPADACYANPDVLTSAFIMKYAGRQISAEPTKTTTFTDKSGDGIAEIRVTFSKDNLRTLFSGTGLSNGHNPVVVTIEGSLANGGKLSGTTQVDVVNNGNFTVATVSPNPLNPEATLTFTTTRQGAVRIDLFDIQGRLVRRLVDESALSAGTHDVTIDGRGMHGEKLPSGIYYIRGTGGEGEFRKVVAILK